MILARVQTAFDALVKGGLIGIKGLEPYLPREIRVRLEKYGWRRLCTKVAVGLTNIWAPSVFPFRLGELLQTALFFAVLDP